MSDSAKVAVLSSALHSALRVGDAAMLTDRLGEVAEHLLKNPNLEIRVVSQGNQDPGFVQGQSKAPFDVPDMDPGAMILSQMLITRALNNGDDTIYTTHSEGLTRLDSLGLCAWVINRLNNQPRSG